jgi:hypothetical protein
VHSEGAEAAALAAAGSPEAADTGAANNEATARRAGQSDLGAAVTALYAMKWRAHQPTCLIERPSTPNREIASIDLRTDLISRFDRFAI